jgi:hypothetical protein
VFVVVCADDPTSVQLDLYFSSWDYVVQGMGCCFWRNHIGSLSTGARVVAVKNADFVWKCNTSLFSDLLYRNWKCDWHCLSEMSFERRVRTPVTLPFGRHF